MKYLVVVVIALWALFVSSLAFSAPAPEVGQTEISPTALVLPAVSAEVAAVAKTKVATGYSPVAIVNVGYENALDLTDGAYIDGNYSVNWSYWFADKKGNLVARAAGFDDSLNPAYIRLDAVATWFYPLPQPQFRPVREFIPTSTQVNEALKAAKRRRPGTAPVFISGGLTTEINPTTGDRFLSPGWPLWQVDLGRSPEQVAQEAGITIYPAPVGSGVVGGGGGGTNAVVSMDALLVSGYQDEPWTADYQPGDLRELVYLARDWSGKLGGAEEVVVFGSWMTVCDVGTGQCIGYYPVLSQDRKSISWRGSNTIAWDRVRILWTRPKAVGRPAKG